MVRQCLLFIAYAEPKLTIPQLRQAVSTPDALGSYLGESNTVTDFEISRRCSSLIRKSQDGKYFEFAHFSVQEFLEDEDALVGSGATRGLARYLICEGIAQKMLAKQSMP